MNCPPCHKNCNEGRDCPYQKQMAEKHTADSEVLPWLIIAFIVFMLTALSIHSFYYS